MTSDPVRLLAEDDGERAFSRSLLASLGRSEPPAGAREAGWNGVARQIAVLGVASAGVSVAASSASAAKGAATMFGLKTAALLKFAAGLGVVGAASIGVVAVSSSSGSGEVASVPAAPRTPVTVVAPALLEAKVAPLAFSPAPAEACRGAECEDEKAPPRSIPQRLPTETERADLLSRESALLVKARAALRASNVAEASALLTRLESQFPRGMLTQEREVLRIELLDARGERAAAAARARAFIAVHPKSPHSAKLNRFAADR